MGRTRLPVRPINHLRVSCIERRDFVFSESQGGVIEARISPHLAKSFTRILRKSRSSIKVLHEDFTPRCAGNARLQDLVSLPCKILRDCQSCHGLPMAERDISMTDSEIRLVPGQLVPSRFCSRRHCATVIFQRPVNGTAGMHHTVPHLSHQVELFQSLGLERRRRDSLKLIVLASRSSTFRVEIHPVMLLNQLQASFHIILMGPQDIGNRHSSEMAIRSVQDIACLVSRKVETRNMRN